LWELVETEDGDEYVEEGIDFYDRLLAKPDEDLVAGDLPRDEVAEGLARIRALAGEPIE
jgi:hypothetical protein